MCKIPANRRFFINVLFISAILLNVQLINTQIINENNSLETNLPDLIPNKSAITKSNQISHITSVSSNEEDEIQSTLVNTPKSTTQNQEDQAHIINDQTSSTLDILEETANTIQFNIKHEISNSSFISTIESQILTESSKPQLLAITDTQLEPLDMDELPIKVQKCCPSGQIMILGQPGEQSFCQVSNEDFDVPVFHSNSTHYWNYTSTAASDVVIVARDPCKQSKFFMDPTDENDTFRIFSNTSLYIPFSLDMLNIDQYCVDTIQGSDGIFTSAIICTSPPKANLFHYLYIIGLCISVVALILLATYTLRRKDIKEDHKKCFAIFAGIMATSYFFIIIQTIFYNYFNYNINLIIAYLIYYLNLNYYLWLTMFSYDIYKYVRDSKMNASYMKWYIIATSLIPFILMVVSFIDGFKPPLPNLYLEHNFSSSNMFVLFLYILPVLASIIGNIILMCSLSLPQERYNHLKDFIAALQSNDWRAPPRNIREIKKMYRRSLALFGIILVTFIFDIVINYLPSTGKQQIQFIFRDVIYCLHGLFISMTFLKSNWFSSTCCRNNNNINNETELAPITNGTV